MDMHMHHHILAALVAALSLASPMGAQVNVEVDLADRRVQVSPTLYGIFFEDINHAADGGLYAELVRNRSMEFSRDTPDGWEPVSSQLELCREGMLNDVQTQALRVRVGAEGGGVRNTGYWGMNVTQGTKYRLSLWVRAQEGKPGRVTASLQGRDGAILGMVEVPGKVGKRWRRLEAVITATGTDPQATLVLSVQKPCTLVLDVVSLFPPTFKDRPNGCRRDLAQMLQALHPAFMRFPGGCVVEGNISPQNAWRWERTVGPIERRPGHMNANWGYPSTDGLGFHEYLQLCEDLGAKPLYVVNVGIWHGGCTPVDSLQGWIDECLAALEYANGPVTSRYGKMRAENGHPAPFNIAYVEIGNENYNYRLQDNSDQSDHYPERYRLFYDAIKARFPEVQCIGNVEAWGTDMPTWRNSHPVDILDEHYYRSPQWFVSQFHRFDHYDRQGPAIYPGEYAVTQNYGQNGNMNAALGEAVFMMGMENNSDIVRMSSYAPIFINENSSQWHPDMIRFNSAQAFGTPSYWVQQLFPTHLGTHVVGSRLTWSLPRPQGVRRAHPVQVGVGTWATRASFRNAQVIVDGDTMDIKPGRAWAAANPRQGGEWAGTGDTLRQTSMAQGTARLCPISIRDDRYTWRVEARKDGGDEGFLMLFDYADRQNYGWFNVGGWANTQSAIEQTAKGNKSKLPGGRATHIKDGVWHTLQVDVDRDSVACLVDGQVYCHGMLTGGDMRGVYSTSTLDEQGGMLYTKVVNLGSAATDGTLTLSGGHATSATITRLAAGKGTDENTMQEPMRVSPVEVEAQVEADGRTIYFAVPPFSISILSVRVR